LETELLNLSNPEKSAVSAGKDDRWRQFPSEFSNWNLSSFVVARHKHDTNSLSPSSSVQEACRCLVAISVLILRVSCKIFQLICLLRREDSGGPKLRDYTPSVCRRRRRENPSWNRPVKSCLTTAAASVARRRLQYVFLDIICESK